MTITLGMFKALCTFDQITPWFLNLIFGLGKKTKSFDEDYMACYQDFFASDRAGKRALVKHRDDAHCRSNDKKPQCDSYGQSIFTPAFESDLFSLFTSQ